MRSSGPTMSASAAGPCGFSLLLFFVFAAAEQLDDCPELPQWDTTVTERKTLRVSWTPRTPIGAENEGFCFCYPVLPDESENIACSLGTTSSNLSCWNATEGTNSMEVPLNGDSSGSICMLSGCGRSECTPIELPDTSTEAYVEVVFVNSTTITFSWNNSYDTEGDINYFVVRWCVQENECFDDTSWLGNCSRTGDTKTQDYTYTVNNLSVGENVRLMVAAVTPLENEGVQLGPPLIGCFQTFPTELETVTDLRGYPVDPNGISLTWEKSGQARDVLSGYFVHWCVEENTSCAEAEKNANRCSDYSWKVVKDTALNTTNIPVNSALFVRISPTFNLPGSTQRSSHETETCFDSRQTSPGAVSDLELTNVTSSELSLSWTAPIIGGEHGRALVYRVLWCVMEDGCDPLRTNVSTCALDSSEVTVTNATVEGLPPWKWIAVAVSAINFALDGTELEGNRTVQCARTEVGEPSAPRDPEEDTAATSTTLSIKWSPPKESNGPIDGYYVSWKRACQARYNLMEDETDAIMKNTTNTSVTITELRPYIEYVVSVSAFNLLDSAVIEGAPVSGMFKTAVGAPGPPVISMQIGSRSAAVFLGVPMEANGPINGSYFCNRLETPHPITISTASDCTKERQTRSPFLLLEELVPGKEYLFKAKAFNLDAQNATVNGTYASYSYWTKPAEPSRVSKFEAIQVGSRDVTLRWFMPREPNGNITGYQLSYNVSDGDITLPSSTFNITIVDLEPYTFYSAEIHAYIEFGSRRLEGDSSLINFRTSPEPPGPMENLTASAFKNNTVILTWKLPTKRNGELQSFEVTYNATKDEKPSRWKMAVPVGTYRDLCSEATSTCSLTVENLTAEYTYTFDVRGRNVGVPELGEEATLQVFLPPGDPPLRPNASTVVHSVSPPEPQSQHVFVIANDTFSDKNGDIISYRVVVGDPVSIRHALASGEGGKERGTSEEFSRQERTPVRIVTPHHWNPFKKGASRDDPLKCEPSQADVESMICYLGVQDCEQTNEPCNGPLKAGTTYSMFIVGITNGGESATMPVEFTTQLPRKETGGDVGAIIAGILVTLLVMVFILGIAYYYRRRRERFTFRPIDSSKADQWSGGGAVQAMVHMDGHVIDDQKSRSPSDSLQETPLGSSLVHLVNLSNGNAVASGQTLQDEVVREEQPRPVVADINKPILKVDFKEHMEFMKKDSGYRFADEYERLVELSPQHPSEVARNTANSKKNRFTNIYPFDQSRVPLSVVGNDEHSSYINASFIKGCNGDREYIAAQGPNLTTIDDFWRMIWEHDVKTVVMLTQLVENNKKKCEKYWPDDEGEHGYGNVQVKKQTSVQHTDFVLTEFAVKSDDSSKWRTVRHIFFTEWKDHGIPEAPQTLISFVRTCQGIIGPRGGVEPPVLVHCSAGVGRTGTFIALDCALQQLERQDDIDIFHLVLDLRECRRCMVQNERQYVYLYQCVNAVIEEMLSGPNSDDPIYENVATLKSTQE